MRGISRVVAGVFALALVGALASLARAQSTEVLPPSNAALNGGDGNSIPLGSNNGGAYQVLYEPSQLVGLPIGGRITSIRLRQRNAETTPWPPAAAVCADYEIRLGTSTRTAATISTTFANNITGAVLVRDGALNLAANTYPGGAATGATPEGWGPVIAFSTPYTYTGGSLVIEFRNNGNGATTHFADAVTAFTQGAAIGNTTAQTSTSGFTSLPLVVLLGIEPATTEQVTLPNANDTVAGPTGNYIPFAASTGGRQLTLYAADQLADIPAGSLIMGLRLRQRNFESTPWPPSAFTASDYEIWLSRSARTPATVSATFADNILDPVRVRDGARDFTLNEFPGGPATGATPEAWGPLIAFDTPYLYTGGVLGLEFRTNGGGPLPPQFADVVSNGATAAGLASTTSPTNPTGNLNGAIIARFTYVPPVESPFGEGVTKIYAIKQFADTPAPSNQAVLSFSSSYTSEFVFAPGQFETVGPGTWLTALSLRNDETTAWPPVPTTATSYDILLSQSLNSPATLSTTVFSNVGPDDITVRSGSLSVATGEMAAAPANGTAPFTWQIPFSTPYSYRTGSLLAVFSNTGFASAGEVDAIAFNAPEVPEQTAGFFGPGTFITSATSRANVPVMRFSADAQVIVPNSAKVASGHDTSSFINTPYSSSDSTIQFVLAGSELSYIPVGGVITSLSFRTRAIQFPWPGAAGALAEDYSVEISTAANRPLNASTTFANNVGSDALIVRSGPISWLPGALPGGSAGKFGGVITFDRPFVYTGGDLCITIRHSGVTNGDPFVSADGTPERIRVVRNSGKTATSGSFFSVGESGFIVQLGYIPTDITPRSARNADGTAGNRFIFAGNRAYQMLYNADQVGVPVGATINGVSFRIDNDTVAAFFPAADFTLDRFDITMSSATSTAATMNDTFANNEGSDVTTVRSGPITIPKGSYPGFTPQRPFGLFIPFTRPFVYKGGPITMLLRSGAESGASSSVGFDATNNGAAGKRSLGNADATSATGLAGAIIARFAFTDDAFCPWDLNNDGFVDDLDFQAFVFSYNILDCSDAGMAVGCPGDFTLDRFVDDDDFVPFVQAYNDLLCP